MDAKIVVKNTCVIINDYEIHDCQKLEDYFTIWDPTIHAKYTVCVYYDAENKRLYLPRGLDIWYLEELFGTTAYVEKNQFDKFDTFKNMKIKYKPRDEVQEKALKFLLGKAEYSETTRKSQLLVNLNTGKGKTYVSIANTVYCGIKSMIITANVSVLNQWSTFIKNYTNTTDKEIYFIEQAGSIYRLLCKSEEEIAKIKFFLVTHATLKSYGDSQGWDKVTELFKHIRIGFKYYDEAHQNFDNMCKIDYFTNTYKTFYVTATPGRSNQSENKIYQLAFKNVLSIELFNREQDPHTDYIAFRYNSSAPAGIISRSKNKYGLDRNYYTNYIVHNYKFKLATICVLNYVLRLAKNVEDKVLIYIGTNDAISYMYQWLPTVFPMLYGNLGIYTSIIPNEQKQSQLQNKVILTTTKSAGAAIDIKGLKVTLVLAEPFKSEILAKQTLGRTRDDNTFYVELVDRGFYYCNKYFLDKKKIFNVYAKSCTLIDLTDNDLNINPNKILQNISNNFSEFESSILQQSSNKPFGLIS